MWLGCYIFRRKQVLTISVNIRPPRADICPELEHDANLTEYEKHTMKTLNNRKAPPASQSFLLHMSKIALSFDVFCTKSFSAASYCIYISYIVIVIVIVILPFNALQMNTRQMLYPARFPNVCGCSAGAMANPGGPSAGWLETWNSDANSRAFGGIPLFKVEVLIYVYHILYTYLHVYICSSSALYIYIYTYVLTVKSHFRWVLLGMFLGHFIFVFLRKAKRAFLWRAKKLFLSATSGSSWWQLDSYFFGKWSKPHAVMKASCNIGSIDIREWSLASPSQVTICNRLMSIGGGFKAILAEAFKRLWGKHCSAL